MEMVLLLLVCGLVGVLACTLAYGAGFDHGWQQAYKNRWVVRKEELGAKKRKPKIKW